eukprot:355359-Chlamydomonas_euryale.AAC.20
MPGEAGKGRADGEGGAGRVDAGKGRAEGQGGRSMWSNRGRKGGTRGKRKKGREGRGKGEERRLRNTRRGQERKRRGAAGMPSISGDSGMALFPTDTNLAHAPGTQRMRRVHCAPFMNMSFSIMLTIFCASSPPRCTYSTRPSWSLRSMPLRPVISATSSSPPSRSISCTHKRGRNTTHGL